MSTPELKVLVVDDEPEMCQMLCRRLKEAGYAAVSAGSSAEALQRFRPGAFPVIILDIRMEEEDTGLHVLRKIREQDEEARVIMLTAYPHFRECQEAGAFYYLRKVSAIWDDLLPCVEIAFQQWSLSRQMLRLEQEVSRFRDPAGLIGDSKPMQQVRQQIKTFAAAPRPVLVRGERGTGKELVARALHEASLRCHGPFVIVNCGALAEGVLASELFGQEANAYHNAPFKLGRFELAHNGTLFLDEIGNMSLEFQEKILRVIEYQEFERMQGTETVKVDVRLVAATNADLEQAMTEGRFREDLYDRLAFATINVPPLRERKEDIPALVGHFLRKFAHDMPGLEVKHLLPGALERLQTYDWPGNVRELKNVIERAALLATGKAIIPDVLHLERLPLSRPLDEEERFSLPPPAQQGPISPATEGVNVEEEKARCELNCVRMALEACHYDKTRAAQWLGLKHREDLYRRVKKNFQKFPQLQEEFADVREAFHL